MERKEENEIKYSRKNGRKNKDRESVLRKTGKDVERKEDRE
jgi:hypothetical protein